MSQIEKEHKGRTKGTPNKNTKALLDKAAEMNVDPFEVLLLFVKGDYDALGYSEFQTRHSKDGESYEVYTIEPRDRLNAAEKACAYLYPKRKSIEFQGDSADANIEIKITRFNMEKHAPKNPGRKLDNNNDESGTGAE